MKDEKTEVAIEIDGAGIKFKSKISPTTAGNILKLCLSEKDNVHPIDSPVSELPDTGKKVSLGEFIHKYEPTTYPEKILSIAAYLKEFRGKETFSPEDINPLFRQMGDIPPRNFSRDFRKTIMTSWIAQDDRDPNSFYITQFGFKALNSNFSGESKKIRVKKKKKNNEAVSE